MMSDFFLGGGVQMTPKNWIIEGKNRIKGGRGVSKMTLKNWTSFMYDPLWHSVKEPLGSNFGVR